MRSDYSASDEAKSLRKLVGRVNASLESVSQVASLYGGTVHGDTETEIDVEFPNLSTAVAFFSGDAWGWNMYLRDTYTIYGLRGALRKSVVITVLKD